MGLKIYFTNWIGICCLLDIFNHFIIRALRYIKHAIKNIKHLVHTKWDTKNIYGMCTMMHINSLCIIFLKKKIHIINFIIKYLFDSFFHSTTQINSKITQYARFNLNHNFENFKDFIIFSSLILHYTMKHILKYHILSYIITWFFLTFLLTYITYSCYITDITWCNRVLIS